jgi:hypothetical protein
LFALQSILVAQNKLSGTLPDWVGELPVVQYVDFSANAFNGSVPESWRGLAGSAKGIALAGNDLTGRIRSSSPPPLRTPMAAAGVFVV